MRRWHWALLLPVFLLLTQQGQIRHEIGHIGNPLSSSQKQAPGTADHCSLCLAFSHIGDAVKPEVVTPALVAGLRFHQGQGPMLGSAEPGLLTARNRGPPTL